MSVFADYSAANINDLAVRTKLADGVLENFVQEICHRPGFGVNESFSTDLKAGQIRILKFAPLSGDARQIGAALNGAHFNSVAAGIPTTVEYNLDLTYVWDISYDIPDIAEDMLGKDIAMKTSKNISQAVTRQVNASTLAHQLFAVIEDDTNKVVLGATPTNADYFNAVFEIAEFLDNGDESVGIDMFPEEREYLIRPSYFTKLMKSGSLIVGGSNAGQAMIAQGTVDPNSFRQHGTGYVGEINNTPVYKVSNPVWALAGHYLEINDGTGAVTANTAKIAALAKIGALLVCGEGTGRGLAFNGAIKVIDSPAGAGKRLQPVYRWGVEVFYSKSIAIIADDGYVAPTVGAGDTELGSVTAPASWDESGLTA